MEHKSIWLTLGAALLAGALLLSCGQAVSVTGSGNSVATERKVANFTAIQAYGGDELVVTVGSSDSLTIYADDNVLPYLTSTVRGGTLVLQPKPNTNLSPVSRIRYMVTVKALTSLSVTGAWLVQATGIDGDKLEVSSSGASNLVFMGKASDLQVSIAGGGTFFGNDLKSQQAKVTCLGAGTVTVATSTSLDVSADGACVTQYIGSPKVTQNLSGASTVKQSQP